jgi:DNA polymerase I-like protein with 3'-5' exonuclease and polymerase domains
MKPKTPDIRGRIIALDLETTGLQFWSDKIFGVAISVGDEDHYWDLRQDPWVLDWLRAELPQVKLWVNHNIKFDILFLRAANVRANMERVDCTMIRACLINEHEFSYDLDSLGRKYLKEGKEVSVYEKLAALFGGAPTKHAQAENLHRGPADIVGEYAKQDTRLALRLWEWQQSEIARQGLERISALERRLLPVVVRMEWGGVRVDVGASERADMEVGVELENKRRRLNDLAGFEINPNPSGSIHRLFEPREQADGSFLTVCGTPLLRTNGGKPKLDAEALRRIKHPAAPIILEVRQLLRMRDTFLEGHVLGHHHNGVIHANFNQTKGDTDHGTGTGRFSVDSPALQQIPKRNKRIAKVVRSVFIPDSGSEWCCADWSQFEFRWFAHFSKNPGLIRTYNEDPDADFHQMVADMTGLPRVMTPGIKGNAKQINLGLVFGMGEGKLCEQMGLPYTIDPDRGYLIAGSEGKEVFALYHSRVTGVKEYLRKASSIAKERGYLISMMGRHQNYPGGMYTHKAGGVNLQTNAADALKVKMIELDEVSQAYNFRLMLVVHDESNISVQPRDVKALAEIKRILEAFGPSDTIPMRVPVRTDPTTAENWWEASKD